MRGKYPKSKEQRERMRQAHLGKEISPETRKKISLSLRGVNVGEKCNWWRGGISSMNERIRKSSEYKLWRTAVFERDKYTCIWCGITGVYVEADHIKPFAYFPELRFAIDNGRTLCRPCHLKTDTFGNKAWKELKHLRKEANKNLKK